MRAKDARRVHVGPHLTFLFENHETILYQVQEMMRAERMVKEADIVHEIETYNELLGGPGEVGCTLLVELDDPSRRAEKLTQWLALPKHLYVARKDGTKAYARYDERQVGDTRVSSVQYLKFEVGSAGAGRRRLRPPRPGAPPRDGAHRRAAGGAPERPRLLMHDPRGARVDLSRSVGLRSLLPVLSCPFRKAPRKAGIPAPPHLPCPRMPWPPARDGVAWPSRRFRSFHQSQEERHAATPSRPSGPRPRDARSRRPRRGIPRDPHGHRSPRPVLFGRGAGRGGVRRRRPR